MTDNGVRVCGVSDAIGQGGDCRWPDGNVSYAILKLIPGLTIGQFKANCRSVYDHIEKHCGLTFTETFTARLARITLTWVPLDGPSGVLADSRLPCGNTTQCPQRYDSSERWSFALEKPASNSIWFWMVLLHETLHAVGIGHAPAGTNAVIAPTYNPDLDGLQAYDIQQLQRRYGPPKQKPTTPTNTGGSPMGGLKGLLDLITKIGPLLDLLQDPAFMQLLDKIVKLFGNKQALAVEDLEALKAELDSDIQQMRA